MYDTDARSPRDVLMQLITGHWVSRAIHVVATLGIADLLDDGPKVVDELAKATGTHPTSLNRLLRALASVGVFAEVDGRFGLTPLAEYLRTDAAGSVRDWAINIGQPYVWSTWEHLLDSVRTGESAFHQLYGTTAWDYREDHPKENEIFNRAMTALSAGVVDAVVQSYDFSEIRVLVDVGGGEGSLLGGILAANANLRGILFDQPHVLAAAGARLKEAGVAERCEVIGGSFFDSVPSGADAYLLKSIVHDWDDDSAIKILRRCREAIADTGKLLLVERVIRPGNDPDPAKFMDLNMLVMLGGRERTADEFGAVYAEAGFVLNRVIPTGSGPSIIEGRPV